MSTKQRQPRELLSRLREHAINEYNTPGLNDWHWAALGVSQALAFTLAALPPDPVKRAYYGAKGSMTNPFR